MASALAGLDEPNREAWALYRQVVTQLAADLHAGGVVLERLTRDLSPSEFADMWRRVSLLYSTLNPPTRPQPSQET